MKFCWEKCKRYFLVAFCILWMSNALMYAQNPASLPATTNKMFNDFASMVATPDAQFIENQLRTLDNNAGIQIAIVSIDDLADYDIADYAVELGRKWGVGKNDLGLLILIAKNNHKIWFATGRRMEQYLPDITCKHIIQNAITPYFKEGKFYLGLQNALLQIINILNDTYDGNDPNVKSFYETFLADIQNENGALRNAKSAQSFDKISFVKGIGIFIFVIIIVIIISKFRGGGGGTFIGSGMGSSWGGSSNRSGGSGISFGGFGGGSFGGGGAGGSW